MKFCCIWSKKETCTYVLQRKSILIFYVASVLRFLQEGFVKSTWLWTRKCVYSSPNLWKDLWSFELWIHVVGLLLSKLEKPQVSRWIFQNLVLLDDKELFASFDKEVCSILSDRSSFQFQPRIRSYGAATTRSLSVVLLLVLDLAHFPHSSFLVYNEKQNTVHCQKAC